jgi:hypothetical protein
MAPVLLLLPSLKSQAKLPLPEMVVPELAMRKLSPLLLRTVLLPVPLLLKLLKLSLPSLLPLLTHDPNR